MAETTAHVDPSQTTDEATSQPLLKIQSSTRCFKISRRITNVDRSSKSFCAFNGDDFFFFSAYDLVIFDRFHCCVQQNLQDCNIPTYEKVQALKETLCPDHETSQQWYWSLILQDVYEKEGILVPTDVPKAELTIYQHLKIVEDDSDIFPTVARIYNVMLSKVDPTNPMLIAYLSNINPNMETGDLLPKGVEGTSKRSKGSKKGIKAAQSKLDTVTVEKEITKPVQDHVSHAEKGPEKEVVPSKSGVLKRTKNPTHRPRHSPKRRPIVDEVPEKSLSSPTWGSVLKFKKIRKP
ncbi:unnamed protein product [Lactuca virosa]|uniref:Uncharacterized protein n=1 Tax=Lactuca virosa TaxID=75947 RepID=A0AAU9MJP3_9ASTR|nr:unnamed protein product [Lactuca virosa]